MPPKKKKNRNSLFNRQADFQADYDAPLETITQHLLNAADENLRVTINKRDEDSARLEITQRRSWRYVAGLQGTLKRHQGTETRLEATIKKRNANWVELGVWLLSTIVFFIALVALPRLLTGIGSETVQSGVLLVYFLAQAFFLARLRQASDADAAQLGDTVDALLKDAEAPDTVHDLTRPAADVADDARMHVAREREMSR